MLLTFSSALLIYATFSARQTDLDSLGKLRFYSIKMDQYVNVRNRRIPAVPRYAKTDCLMLAVIDRVTFDRLEDVVDHTIVFKHQISSWFVSF